MSPEFEYIYRRRFASFVDFAFRELHPGELMKSNWHIQFIADLLEFFWMTKSPELTRKHIFNLPPNSLKTHICSVSLPAWILARDPRKSVLIISETADHALEIRELCAELIGSPRFRALFPYVRIARHGKRLELTQGGGITHAGVGYSLPSRRSDLVVIDNPQSLHSLGRSEPTAYAEIDRALKNPEDGMVVMATRRLGKDDLSAVLGGMAGWTPYRFPAISMQECELNFPPGSSYRWLKGVKLQEASEDWETFERYVVAIGGEAFGWQYMQGLYQPKVNGERLSHIDKDGIQWKLVGNLDPTTVALEDVRKWRQEFLWTGRT